MSGQTPSPELELEAVVGRDTKQDRVNLTHHDALLQWAAEHGEEQITCNGRTAQRWSNDTQNLVNDWISEAFFGPNHPSAVDNLLQETLKDLLRIKFAEVIETNKLHGTWAQYQPWYPRAKEQAAR